MARGILGGPLFRALSKLPSRNVDVLGQLGLRTRYGSTANIASFLAWPSSTQAIATTSATQIALGDIYHNIGGYFGSNKWVPPRGPVILAFQAASGSLASATAWSIAIRKNGSDLFTATRMLDAANIFGWYMDVSDGDDEYTLYTTSADSSYSIQTGTWFAGSKI